MCIRDSPADKARVRIVSQAVASKVLTEGVGKKVTGIQYRIYQEDGSAPSEPFTVTADTYVLAANAIENATLLLASDAANSSRTLGKHLMDHPLLLTWGLLDQDIWGYRGPGSTSGIPAFRDGDFRSEHSSFRIEIGNWGWNFPAGSPYSTVDALVAGGADGSPRTYGGALRSKLGQVLPKQFRLAMELEQLPDPVNEVSIDPRFKDALGNHRPVIRYNLSPYVRAGLPAALSVSRQMFRSLGMTEVIPPDQQADFPTGEYSYYKTPADPGFLTYEGVDYLVRGAGHLAGTHRMGKESKHSVVDKDQRSWDHPNLYVVGCGSMPTIGTSNPTLTMTALAIRTGDVIAKGLSSR